MAQATKQKNNSTAMFLIGMLAGAVTTFVVLGLISLAMYAVGGNSGTGLTGPDAATKEACEDLARDKFDNVTSVEYIGEEDGYLVYSVDYRPSYSYYSSSKTTSTVQYCRKVGSHVIMGGMKD